MPMESPNTLMVERSFFRRIFLNAKAKSFIITFRRIAAIYVAINILIKSMQSNQFNALIILLQGIHPILGTST